MRLSARQVRLALEESGFTHRQDFTVQRRAGRVVVRWRADGLRSMDARNMLAIRGWSVAFDGFADFAPTLTVS